MPHPPFYYRPNLITLLGFILMVVSLIIVGVLCPNLDKPLHPYFYLFFTSCIWIYSTFDNVDGKQARRTGTSSPLGELFDHGCDSLNCWMLGLIQLASVCGGTGKVSSLLMLVVLWGFYLPTWENYHTGVLYLGFVNGPTEGIIIECTVILISAIYGPGVWHRPLLDVLPFMPFKPHLSGVSLLDLVAFLAIGGAVTILIPSSFITVYLHCRETGKSFRKTLHHFTFMFFSTVAAYSWLWSPYTTARMQHYVLFFVTVGIAFGKMTTKIILAHLLRKPFPQYTGLMIPLLFGACIFNLPFIMPSLDSTLMARLETVYLWVYFGIVIVGYANWIYHVINSFCTYLDINCLTIKSKRKTFVDNKTDVPNDAQDTSLLLTKKQYAAPLKPKRFPSKLVL